MNICMFTNTYLPHVGGVARSVHFFAEDLRQLGHRVLVVAPSFNGERDTEPDTVRLTAVQNFNGSDFSVRVPLPYVVEREITAFQPDIIHSHHPFLLGDTALRVARQRSLPLVFTHHTLYEEYTHYVPIDSDRLKSFVINLATLYANACNGVVAPSPSIARLIRSRGVVSRIAEIPTGVDIDFFANGNGRRFRKSEGIGADVRVIGHVGRLAPEKNLSFLAEAVLDYMQKQPKTIFAVIGEGPVEEEMVTLFREADMEDRLVMGGRRSGQDLADAYAAMDLFVFASFSETQGMVLAEAMASGVPVVAIDAPGVRDIVVEGRNGRLLPETATRNDFAAALQTALDGDLNQVRSWRKGALKTARQQSRQACAHRLAEFYGDFLEAAPPSDNASDNGIMNLERLVERIKTEWDLFAAKVKSAVEATPPEEADDHNRRRTQI